MSERIQTEKLLADVSLIDAARVLGIHVPANKKIRCPFHNDKDPSMVLYRNRYKCFVCGTGRTIEFVQKVGNLSFKDACDWLINSFGLIREQYIISDEQNRPKAKSTKRTKRTYHYLSPEVLGNIGIVNNPVKGATACLPMDAYREINYPGFIGYVRRNFIKYMPKEYKNHKPIIATADVRGKKVEVLKLLKPEGTACKQFIYIQNIYDAVCSSRNTGKVFHEYALAYVRAENEGIDMVEEYRAKSSFDYHIEREDGCCVKYEVMDPNPLQSLFETDKEAYEFLISSCAKNRMTRIDFATEVSSMSRSFINRKEIKSTLSTIKETCEKTHEELLRMSTPA